MSSCDKAAKMMDRSEFEKLSLKEKISLRIHNSYCKGCRNYNSFIKKISSIFEKERSNPPCLSDREKNDLKEQLNK